MEDTMRLGHREPVIYRHALNARQNAVAHAGDYTVDPDYLGIIPISSIAL